IKMFTKKLFSFLLIYAVVFTAISCVNTNSNKQTVQKPNIIFVLADDLGYGDVSCFNEKSKIKTPNIDKMAAEGMRFTDMHTSSSVCTPTRYGILTGRYNWRSPIKQGVLSGSSKALIPTSRTIVASLLKRAGYHTGYIGKWHLGWDWSMDEEGKIDFSKPVTHTPNDLGFDYAYGHCGSLDMAPYVYVENGMPTAIPDSIVEASKVPYVFYREGDIAPDFDFKDVTPNFFRHAMSFISKQAQTKNPFFLYLPIPSPHTPIVPTKEWQGKSGLNPYGDFVMEIDKYMGELLKTIKDSGIEKNTLIIFTSDNGCSPQAKFDVLLAKGHNPSYVFRGHKADIFEGGHRVAYIAKWPAVIKNGTTYDKTVCSTDFMATCADIAGIQLKDNEGEDSYSLMPVFKNPSGKGYKREYTIHHSINGSFSIRKGDWKLEVCPGSGGWSDPRPQKAVKLGLPDIQLYDLKTDIAEKSNVYKKYPEKVKELYSLLIKCVDDGRSTPGEKQTNDPSMKGKWKQYNHLKTLDIDKILAE
ncbi:MAG: arylsulfatase, partial [Prolixibacteraceae bacterium]|nr:arylsulfatase [Prolixibacteraceae bacterium]